ncbi:MAG: DNA glycosylase AlkZ-like family protein, partial [Candidatus Sericytochromatia bacterium]
MPAMTATPTLSLRALNRATLARQLLLARSPLSPAEAVHRLFAMQAQLARPPFIGLWTRLEGFERQQLMQAVHARELVRATHLRATLHLMTAADYQATRATIQPVLDAGFQGILKSIQKQRGAGIPDLAPLIEAARAAFEAQPRPFEPMRQALLAQFPDADDRAMGYAVRTQLPLVQVPTDAAWGWPGTA